MPSLHARTEILLGKETVDQLHNYHVLVAGVGGVGGYVAENLARAGIGEITLLDSDVVSASNINRQIIALQSTIGQKKTEVMKVRIADIDPTIKVNIIDQFMDVESAETIVKSGNYDFIADCIDTIACKAQLVLMAQHHGVAIMSAMGAGNRLDASKAQVSQLNRTRNCALAREMRRRLRGLEANLKYPVVYTDEPRCAPVVTNASSDNYDQKATNGTISYMPAIFGLLMTGEILKRLMAKKI